MPIGAGLTFVYHLLHDVPVINDIGAYGIAIIIVTILIKLVLSPLYEFQIRTGRKTMLQQRALAPEIAELKKRHKGEPQKLQAAQMELYRERGINPLSSMSGCLPSLLQIPILSALYWTFYNNNAHVPSWADHFLFIPHLNTSPHAHLLISSLPIPSPIYLILPVLAGLTTFVQSRMMQQPKNPAASEQEQQTQGMMKSMQVLMPVMIIFFAISVPAGLALYWFVSNCFAILQQYRVNGWGGLRPKLQQAAMDGAMQAAMQKAGVGKGPRSSASLDRIPAKRSSASRDAGAPAAATATGGAPASGQARAGGASGGQRNGQQSLPKKRSSSKRTRKSTR
ncbi:MAG: YidC/Oxa1 family membrane protein insertase [Candidatus Dormiibacterota bacterium]